ncbi:MAG: sulfatase-like hydrolase/transferase, partial [Marinoscillum sp.]
MRKLYHYLQFTRAILTIGLLGTHLALYAQNPPEKKNLLFIMADQFRYDVLSIANSNSVVATPNLDRLAAEGVMFSNAYTPMAVCGPARACILTGHTVENTGVNTNDKTYDYSGNVMNMPTFDEILDANGYQSEYYGKWHTLTSKAQVYQNPVKQANNGASVFGSGGQTHIYR